MNQIVLPKIIVIDDEMSICIAIKDLLSFYGYDVEYAMSAEEGIEYLEENSDIDAVILDINLGSGLNGIEALELIKERFKYTQVIMLTSMNTLEKGVECIKKGALEYLTKPYDDSELLKKIATALEKKKLEQMNDLYQNILVHDLKNPLQNILGALEIIKISIKDQEYDECGTFIEFAEKGVSLIKTMVNNILSVSKFERGTLVARRESFLLIPQIKSLLEIFEHDVSFQKKFLKTDFPGSDDIAINNDKEFFSQVMINIISNAIRFTPPKNTITVHVNEPIDDEIHISISNTGSYIEEPLRQNIFDKFSCIKLDSRESTGQNFGLGLTYCKMAVDTMGGKIWVDGNKDIPETTFHFTIKNHRKV